jgi:hypothetical protein
MAKTLTAIESFLAPLARAARKHPWIEGLVFWGGPLGWDANPTEALEAEEIAFYSEGLLIDGFQMDWVLVAEVGDEPGHIRLCFWQEGDLPPPLPPGWHALEQGRWTSESRTG